MGFGVTAIFYLVIGCAVATAVFLAEERGAPLRKAFRMATAVLFWPVYLPILLAHHSPDEEPRSAPEVETQDEMAAAIAQVESELDAAFSSLDGWAEGVLAREEDRIRELRTVWTSQATRIREMDQLLVQAEAEQSVPAGPSNGSTIAGGSNIASGTDRQRQSEQARRANLDRLRQVRYQAHDDLMSTLSWVRELVSMIHLAKFTGARASRAEELVTQIAAAVEGVSAFTWQDAFRPSPARHEMEAEIIE